MFYKNFKKKLWLFAICSFLIIIFINIVYALNTVSTGYKINSGETKVIIVQGIIKEVINIGNKPVFVPTKTKEEWDAFLEAYKNAELIFTDIVLWKGDVDHNRKDIILVSEYSREDTEYLLEESFGDGDFSLFKTNPFIGKENKFNIYYYLIPEGDYSGRGECEWNNETNIKNVERFDSIFNKFNWVDYKIYLTKDSRTWAHANKGKYIQMSLVCGGYNDIIETNQNIENWVSKLEESLENLQKEKEECPEIECIDSDGGNNLGVQGTVSGPNIFGVFLEIEDYCRDEESRIVESGPKIAEFSCTSEGIVFYNIVECLNGCQDGACVGELPEIEEVLTCEENIQSQIDNIKNLLKDIDTNKWDDFYESHARTSVHEFGHMFARLDDEYIYIDIKEENVEFNCGDLDNISERWKDIPGWNSFSFSGCTLSNLKRGTFNSIMREQGDYDKETWKDAWGPINEYRLKQELDKI